MSKKKKRKVEKVVKVIIKEKRHRHFDDDCHCKSLCRRFRCRPVCHLRHRCGCRRDHFFDDFHHHW
ncbi:hypothetical protein JOC85_000485 [Bacillus mesophilus]|uniref:Uncharacterized protein n=1 Tax=Bacillus mesophilus TaxID=1808955 RepID=A0A6M0Q2G4_9BACI|nr:hypothetical protein [Bacillus mesophilus]MBM7659718.1 hypothetical protein [Bacillus mesophilus]NEY70581.1 hypothetical protein [Bacillus mesophilus]